MSDLTMISCPAPGCSWGHQVKRGYPDRGRCDCGAEWRYDPSESELAPEIKTQRDLREAVELLHQCHDYLENLRAIVSQQGDRKYATEVWELQCRVRDRIGGGGK